LLLGDAVVAAEFEGLVAAVKDFVTIRAVVITLAIMVAGVTGFVLRKAIWSAVLRVWNHVLRNPRFYTVFIPLAVILGLFAAFYKFFAHTDKGAFGDSFGVITSLFTGLGFAGLTITLVIQQWQISMQKQDSENEKDDSSAARYDATLHQLLDLYKKSVECVVIKSDGTKFEGLDGVGHAHYKMLNIIRKSKAAILPSDVARRYGRGEATGQDWGVLGHLFERNAQLINSTFNRQARVINSFTLLMHHLEDRTPPNFKDIKYARMLVQSQLTTLEMSYFFYFALGFKSEENLRRLLRSSGLLTGFPTACQLEVHRTMYMHLWDYDPKTGVAPRHSTTKPKDRPGIWEIVDEDIA
jgi:hypothetical protein